MPDNSKRLPIAQQIINSALLRREPHPLSRGAIGLVPRSLPSLIERASSPETDQTPDVDTVLLVTTASEVRRLQQEMATMRGQLAAMRQTIRDLSHMIQP